jgi:hypothetical protein
MPSAPGRPRVPRRGWAATRSGARSSWIGQGLPRHAAIRACRPDGGMIEKGDPGDGVWLRVEEIDLGRGGQFQCGEQRFLFRVL